MGSRPARCSRPSRRSTSRNGRGTTARACRTPKAPATPGTRDLWGATKDSINVVFAQLILEVGPDKVVQAAHDMGIESDLPAVPSLTLGTADVTPIEMASAYQTLANDGKHCEPYTVTKVVDADGVLYRHKPVVQAGRRTGDRAPGDRDAAGRRVRWNRHRGGAGVVAGGGQDRDDPGLHERLVRRVHAAGLDRGVGGFPRNARLALAVLRRFGVRRHARGADLARLHAAGHGRDAGRELPGAAGAPVGDGARRGRAASPSTHRTCSPRRTSRRSSRSSTPPTRRARSSHRPRREVHRSSSEDWSRSRSAAASPPR